MSADDQSKHDAEELLGQEARVRRASRMIPARGPLTPRNREEIIYALRMYMGETKLTQAEVARAVGSSATYVNNLFTGSGNLPDATRDELLRDINNWIDREARARGSRRPGEFVETSVARTLMEFAGQLTERPELAYACGPAGIGKTLTAQAIAAELGAVYIMVDEDCQSPSGLRDKLYNALSRKKRQRYVRVAEIVEKLRMPERIATCNLVILDEAHDLRDASFKMMRKIAEQAGCSVLFVGTIDIDRRLNADDDPEYGQLSSRVGLQCDLGEKLSRNTPGGRMAERLFTVQDVREMFAGAKLKLHHTTVRMLASLANIMGGHLRDVERLHYWAEKAAIKKRADKIMPEHVQIAAVRCRKRLPLAPDDLTGEAKPKQQLAEATA